MVAATFSPPKDTYHDQKFCTVMEESIKPQAYKSDWKQFLVDCVCSRKGISFCDTHLWPLQVMSGAEGGCPSQPYSLSLHAFSLFCFFFHIFTHTLLYNPLPCTWHRHHKLKYKPCIDLLYGTTYLKLLNQILKPTVTFQIFAFTTTKHTVKQIIFQAHF